MKKLFLGICAMLTATILFGQSIAGKVLDAATGAPIPMATVELYRQGSSFTNDAGQFRFRKTGSAPVTLTASSVGYETVQQIVVPGNEDLVVRLKKLNLLLEPVEISAVRAGRKAPFAKTNISGRELAAANLGQDLPFLLNQTPSVVIHSDAGNGVGYTGIRIRGTDASRINVTLNGIPYNDAESQGTYFVDLPDFASSVNNLQIQRGVGTSSNGSGSFGATINLNTNEAHTEPYAEVNNSFGSFQTWKHTVKAGSGLINKHFTVDTRLSAVRSNGYIDRASSNLKAWYLSGAYLANKTSVRINLFSGNEKTYQAWYGVSESDLVSNRRINYAGMEKPGEPYHNETDNYRQDHYQLFLNQNLPADWRLSTAFFLTRGKGYYEQYKASQWYSDYGLPDFVTGTDTLRQTDLIQQLWLDNYFYGQIFSLQHKDRLSQLTVGGGWNRYNGRHYGKVIWAQAGIPNDYTWYRHKALKTDLNLYGKYQRSLAPGVDVFADLQYRRVLYEIDGFRDNPDLLIHNRYQFFNPKVGVTYTRNQFQWFASYAIAQKEPNRDDFEAGAAQQPRPEKLHDLEAGLNYNRHPYSWGVTLYFMNYRDQLVLTGKINDVGAYTRSNIPNSYRMGIELEGGAALASWCRVNGNISFSRNRIRNFVEYYDDYDNGGQKSIDHGATNIALSPEITGSAALQLTPWRSLEITPLAKYVSRQYLDNSSDAGRSLKAYFVQDLRMSYTLHKVVFQETAILFQLSNAWNRKYEPNGYTYSYQYGGELVTENYYYPMAGRHYMVALNIRL